MKNTPVLPLSFALLCFFSSAFGQQITLPPSNLPVEGACMNGTPYGKSNPVPLDGNGTLGLTYSNTQCGLNYVQASRKVTTRYATPPGSGNPTTLAISGLPSCMQVVRAYVWYIASYQSGPPASTVTITNPSLVTSTLSSVLAGQGPSKCWAEAGSGVYRCDVTTAISGNGNYTVTMNGFGNPNWEIDGATLMIIYADPTAGYNGTMTIFDGNITGIGSNATATLSGFSACQTTSNASAFLIVSDMQSNINGGMHPSTLNGNTSSYINDFYNFDVANTTVTNGQTTASFGTNGLGSDCFTWGVMGLYYQTTCTPCSSSGLTLTPSSTPAACTGCNGTASVVAAGGTPPYTYSWSNGQTTATATGLCAGTYTVTVIDASGCLTSQTTVTVTAPSAMTVTQSQNNATCNTSCNGSASVTVSGGNPGYTYSWAPSGGTNSSATGLCPGTYTCFITDATGCTTSSSFTITQPAVLTATSGQTNITCNSLCDGSATVTVSGGTPSYTYSWSTNPSQTGVTATGLCAGTYTVIYTDANGCTGSTSFTVTQPNPLSNTTTQTNVPCNSLCNGSATVTVSGGTPAYTYSWSNAQTNTTATSLCAGSYTVFITDANGCTDSASFTITQTAPIVLGSSSSQSTCLASNGSATVNASGGTQPYTYSWSTNPAQTTATASGLPQGSYTVVVTDANGCTSTTTVVVTANNIAITLTLTSPPLICNGQSAPLTATPTNGTGPYAYSWLPGSLTGSAVSVSPTSTTTYTCVIVDANGCTGTQTVVVNVNPPLTAAASGTATICAGDSAQLNVTAGGGTPGYSYSWLPSAGSTSSVTVSPSSTTSYSVIITDAAGCTTLSNVSTITVNPVPSAAFSSSPAASNQGIPVTFTDLSTIISGNISGWSWSFGDGNTSTAQDPVHTYAAPGNYNVCLVVFAGNCVDSICVVYVVEPETIIIPNVITPNGDGKNDVLVFTNLEFFPGSLLKIYNRWGAMVYESDDYKNDWRGDVSDGTYYFVLTVNGKNEQHAGFLEVLSSQ